MLNDTKTSMIEGKIADCCKGQEKLYKLVGKMIATKCTPDPLSNIYIKQNIDILLPVVAKLLSLSFTEGSFPSSCRYSYVLSLLKRPAWS